MLNTIIIDNFFDNFELVETEFKKIPLYSMKDFPEEHRGILSDRIDADGYKQRILWPGQRSVMLGVKHPSVLQLTERIIQKSGDERLKNTNWGMTVQLHLRLHEDEEKDYIHTDRDSLSMIVYLSKTNLKSGTNIYNTDDEVTTNIKFVQNRAVIFDCNQKHRSSLNYGDNIDNGRLTLNCIINFL